jgi:hypothetical protein
MTQTRVRSVAVEDAMTEPTVRISLCTVASSHRIADLASTWFTNEVNVCPLSRGPGESPSGVKGARPPSGDGKGCVGKITELFVDRGASSDISIN